LDETFSDLGRKRITLNENDLGKFKVPSLRNLAFTYPYMHDGRFNTLNKVLDHYDHQIVLSNTLDPALVNGIPLTDEERVVLIAFLNTLNDYTFLSDRTIAEP
jgi:cytochrome c peroxidase